MTHAEAHRKDLERLFAHRPDIMELWRQKFEKGSVTVEELFDAVRERFGLDTLALLTLACDQTNCKAVHPATGQRCQNRYHQTGAHRYAVEWLDAEQEDE